MFPREEMLRVSRYTPAVNSIALCHTRRSRKDCLEISRSASPISSCHYLSSVVPKPLHFHLLHFFTYLTALTCSYRIVQYPITVVASSANTASNPK